MNMNFSEIFFNSLDPDQPVDLLWLGKVLIESIAIWPPHWTGHLHEI